MRVLHYIPSIDRSTGGMAAYMQLLAAELGRMADVHVATHGSSRPVAMSRCTVHTISRRLLAGGMSADWGRLLDELRPDIVHVNTCWLPQCAIAQSRAQAKGYRVVLTPHGMLEPWIIHRHYLTRKLPALLLYQRAAVRRADHVHATATTERDNLLRLGYNPRVTVVPNGIDVAAVTMKQSWQRRREVLFLARVHIKKGVNHLIEAVAQLRDEMEGYTVRIAGEGETGYVDSLRQMAARCGVDDIVHFEGGVYGERKWQLLRRADVMVLPTYSENFGYVVAEALAAGTPVITTDGTPWSDLNTCCCGWQTAVGTAPLIEALRLFLATDDDTLEQMGRRGRRLVEQKYSSPAVASAMLELYRSVVNQ